MCVNGISNESSATLPAQSLSDERRSSSVENLITHRLKLCSLERLCVKSSQGILLDVIYEGSMFLKNTLYTL